MKIGDVVRAEGGINGYDINVGVITDILDEEQYEDGFIYEVQDKIHHSGYGLKDYCRINCLKKLREVKHGIYCAHGEECINSSKWECRACRYNTGQRSTPQDFFVGREITFL